MPGSGAIIREILKLYPKEVIEVASYGIQYYHIQIEVCPNPYR